MKAAGTILAVLVVAGIGYSLFQLGGGNRPIGSENLIGEPLPEFAAPLAGSGIDADSNITSRTVAERSGANAACDVKLPGAFVSCRDLTGDAVVVFWSLRKQACIDQVDELQKAFANDERVNVAAVAFNDDLDDVAATMKERGWTIPVPVDRDGAASILYSVAGCPSIYFARDGVVTGVRLATLDAAQLRREVVSLAREARAGTG
ncbi:MAG: redoxin domain-containing protein [Actinobacteria bacterium]|nr:redoxin domain-containing protein [Actinomycetota bacterium]